MTQSSDTTTTSDVSNHSSPVDCPLYAMCNGGKIPALGYGTSRRQGDRCQLLTEAALEIGYRLFDSAQIYQNEDAIGRAIAASGMAREKLFITTKLHLDAMQFEKVRPAAEASLKALDVPYLDLLLIHWPSRDVPLSRTLAAFAALRREGLIRMMGLSNFPKALLEDALLIQPDLAVNQIEHHPLLQQTKLVKQILEAGLAVMSSRPTARGRAASHPIIADIARRIGRTPHQVVLRWHLEQQNDIVIPGASSREQLMENFATLQFALSNDDMVAISTLDTGERTLHRPYAPAWDND